MDGSLGYPGAVSEMLVQSGYRQKGSIHFLPALPKAWSEKGSVTNFKVRGGHDVSFSWKNGALTSASIVKGPGKIGEIRIQGKLVSATDKRIKISAN